MKLDLGGGGGIGVVGTCIDGVYFGDRFLSGVLVIYGPHWLGVAQGGKFTNRGMV